MLRSGHRGRDSACPMAGGVDGYKKGAGFQHRYLHSGRIRGGITQLPGDATAVIGCWTWVKRAFILPILLASLTGKTLEILERSMNLLL
jgi:hypothetical protein